MSLAFFYPLAWLGALALAVPIWLHLHRREVREVIRFPALRFLDHQPLARRPRLRPRDLLLLLLRLLGLLLLVAAFAWPYLTDQAGAVIQEARVFILDNTLSHQADGGFERARTELVRACESAGPYDQTAVVELTALPRVLAGFDAEPAAVLERLRALPAAHQRGSYLAAFQTAGSLLSQSSAERRRIILLGDNQTNQWTEGRQTPPFLANVEISLPQVATTRPANLALFRPAVQRTFLDERVTAECTVQLYHQGDVNQATVVFQANGQEVARRELSLTGQPELVGLTVQWDSPPDQWLRVEVQVTGQPDVLAGDNRVYCFLPPVREGRVGLLARSPYLRTALSAEIMRGRWQTRLLSADDLAAAAMAHEDEVLCVEGSAIQSAAGRKLLVEHLDRGRGVLLLVDQATPSVSGLLHALNIETLTEAPPAVEAKGFRYVFMEDPLFQPFRSTDFGDLTEIRVSRYRRLKAASAVPLIFSEAGDPLMWRSLRPQGRLLVVAFSLDRRDTNWPLHPTFVPFLDSCLQQVRRHRAAPTVYEPGVTAVWPAPPGAEAKAVVLRKDPATGRQEVVRAAVVDGVARFRVPDAPGLYALSYDDSPDMAALLAVNPPVDESYLTYTNSPETVQAWNQGPASEGELAAVQQRAAEQTKTEILRQSLWWWLLAGGLAATFVETSWLSWRAYPGERRENPFPPLDGGVEGSARFPSP